MHEVAVETTLSSVVDRYRSRVTAGESTTREEFEEACEAAEGVGFNDHANERPYRNPFDSTFAESYRRGFEEARDLDELRRWGEIPG